MITSVMCTGGRGAYMSGINVCACIHVCTHAGMKYFIISMVCKALLQQSRPLQILKKVLVGMDMNLNTNMCMNMNECV